MKKRLLFSLVVLMGMLLFSSSIVCADAPAPVAKTGQTTSYLAGDDGDLEKGVAWPIPRFTDHGDGTVTDNLTGLMWDINTHEYNSWQGSINFAKDYSFGNAGCGASYTDWRLPNFNEMMSLIDFENSSPALPSDHPFINVQGASYWTSSILASDSSTAWTVQMWAGFSYPVSISTVPPVYACYRFYVRGGN